MYETAPGPREFHQAAHPRRRSGEKYCTTLIFLISLIYLSYRFLPYAIISPVGRTYMRACKKTEEERDGGAERAWERSGDIYNSTVTFLSASVALPPLASHASTLLDNNTRRIRINQLITVPFYSPH